MSFDIILQNNSSENIKLDKTLTDIVTLTGTLKDKCSIIDPIIIIETTHANITSANYMTIAEFGRKYFINEIVCLRTGLYEISAHVDVLGTYAADIRKNRAIISRNEHQYDLKLNDGIFKTQQNPRIAQFPFPSGFTNWNFVIGIAGN